MVNIVFTASEERLIAKYRAIDEATGKLAEENIKLARTYREADKDAKFWASGLNRAKKEAEALSKAERDAGNEAIKAAEKMAAFQQKTNQRITDAVTSAVGFQTSGPLGGIGGALGGGVGLAIGASLDGAIALGKEVSSVTEKYNRLQIALDAATGSEMLGGRAFAFVSDLAAQTGQRIETLSASYKTLAANARGTVLEGAGVERIFSAITKRGSEMQLSNEQIKGSLKAIGDMMNKGKIQAEELTQQFSENFPGGAKLFADALGISTAALFKLGEEGKLVATEVLPKVADYLEKTSKGDYAKNLNTITGSWNLLRNEVDLLLVSFGRSSEINTFFASINNGIASAAKKLREFVDGKSWKELIGVLFQKAEYVPIVGATMGMTGRILESSGQAERVANSKKGLNGFKGFNQAQREQKIFQKANEIAALQSFVATRIQSQNFDKEFYSAKDRIAKGNKLLSEMIAIDKKLSAKFTQKTGVANPSGLSDKEKLKAESAFERQIRKENENGKDLFSQRLAIIKAANLEAQRLIQFPETRLATEFENAGLKAPIQTPAKVYGKGISSIQTGLGSELLASAIQRDKFQKMLDSTMSSLKIDISKIKVEASGADVFRPILDTYREGTPEFESMATSLLSGALQNVATNGISAIKNALNSGENPFKAFADSTVGYLGDMMIQMGSMILSTALPVMLGLTAATGGLTAGMATKLAAAGAGMIATGGALKAVNFAHGGVLYGETLGRMAEYQGARSNPEIVSPLNRLTSILNPYFQKALNIGRNGGGDFSAPVMQTVQTNVYFDNKVLLTQIDKAIVKRGRI